MTQPLTKLCQVSKLACDALTPMIVQFYSAINSDTSILKADKSVFTIADGTVQHLLVDHLFSGNKFLNIVGEEECQVNLLTKPYTVDNLVIPDEFSSVVEKARDDMIQLASTIPNDLLYKDMTIFIDPIDGTREFSTGKGEQCTILIGFADKQGLPQAGVAYRPITAPPTWASGAKSEMYKNGNLDMVSISSETKQTHQGGLLTSNGTISLFLRDLMEEMKYQRVPSGGAGNKMLMLLEGKGDIYIQDRGVSRWDTCGTQACIEAHGGVLSKLSSFTGSHGNTTDPNADSSSSGTSSGTSSDASSGGGGGGGGGVSSGAQPGTFESYTYVSSEYNQDFVSGMSWLTAYNVRNKLNAPKKTDAKIKAMEVNAVQPYSNLCGLFAIGPKMNQDAKIQLLMESCLKAKQKNAPSFD